MLAVIIIKNKKRKKSSIFQKLDRVVTVMLDTCQRNRYRKWRQRKTTHLIRLLFQQHGLLGILTVLLILCITEGREDLHIISQIRLVIYHTFLYPHPNTPHNFHEPSSFHQMLSDISDSAYKVQVYLTFCQLQTNTANSLSCPSHLGSRYTTRLLDSHYKF